MAPHQFPLAEPMSQVLAYLDVAIGALHGTSFPGLNTPPVQGAKGIGDPIGKPIATRRERNAIRRSRLRERMVKNGDKLRPYSRNSHSSQSSFAIGS
jgi:hypothetical protein